MGRYRRRGGRYTAIRRYPIDRVNARNAQPSGRDRWYVDELLTS